MSDWSPAKAIAMEERHIAEGEMRVTRQEVLVAKLTENGPQEHLVLAKDLLALLLESIERSRERLLDLRNRYGNPPNSMSQS
jgi:uncharacterized coiled-coil protein SlyX